MIGCEDVCGDIVVEVALPVTPGLSSGSKTNLKTDQEEFIRSNAPTARPLQDIGETGRNLITRLKEHRRATKKGDLNNNIAKHHLKTSHTIDWDSATYVTYSTDYCQRITLESWFTNLEQTALNQPLPAPYKRLLNTKQ